MSRLRDLVEDGESTILTAEAPTVDGGDVAAFGERVAEVASWADAVNVNRQPRGARACVERRRRGCAGPARHRAGAPGGRPRQEPDRLPGRHRRRRAARRRERLLHDRRRRDRGGRARGATRLRPRRPAARPRRHRALPKATTSPGGRLEPAPQLFVGAVENPAAPPLEYRAERAAKKIRRERVSCSSRSVTTPTGSRRSFAALDGGASREQAALLPTIVLVTERARRLSLHGRPASRASTCPRRRSPRVEQAADQSEAAYELALEQAEHALALPGVRGLHLTDFRHDGAVSQLCRDLGIPTKEERQAHAHRAQLAV